MSNNLHRAFIIYERYYDFESDHIVSGGVQTYISNLIPILIESGYKCNIFQYGDNNSMNEKRIHNCDVISVPNAKVNGRYKTKVVIDYLKSDFDRINDLLIFADHILTIRNNALNSISIQHGINWDIPKEKSRNSLHMFLSKARFSFMENQRLKYVTKIVCVDYNFQNWYRTQVDIPNNNFIIIPNFTKIAKIYDKNDSPLKIIFARRFVKHRGTRIFAEVINRLLPEFDNIDITIAGRGEDEEFLHQKLDKWKDRIHFTQYLSEKSLEIHSDKHIAVVPTIGSEGTSLSLLEAMSAQCAVICTDVGGMTNVILDRFNGRIVKAGDVEQLYFVLKEIIENPFERKRMALAGYDSIKYSFSFDRWATQWRAIFDDIKRT